VSRDLRVLHVCLCKLVCTLGTGSHPLKAPGPAIDGGPYRSSPLLQRGAYCSRHEGGAFSVGAYRAVFALAYRGGYFSEPAPIGHRGGLNFRCTPKRDTGGGYDLNITTPCVPVLLVVADKIFTYGTANAASGRL
jgi:hypothetical protein